MVSRLLAGLVHPFIFAGYGLEFGQLGLVAEGLARAAVHNVRTSNLLTRKFLADSAATESLANAFAKKVFLKSDNSVSPLTILARIEKDPRLAP
ncbi:hypothetical protein M422DRAFT_269949 [Sphaerobolus stellatus SS14]|uniref:Uncharacterized protein n=1 Tax=Sphaerobolus stellatus (strain SS14) TaxID=990650 RepID=A0A0C9UU55_SPHS4|nr:hypothetical protein M422DRAFT_269949 [Sphaerobolus stellatus SS14]